MRSSQPWKLFLKPPTSIPTYVIGRGAGAGGDGPVEGSVALKTMVALIEARPGAGKTTAIRRLADLLAERGVALAGFVTEEIREGGKRVGFSIATLDGERGTLAHVDLPGPPRVGRYGVDLEAFERLALPALAAPADVVLIDELGKMELASGAFVDALARELVEGERPVVATVHAHRHPITDELKRRPDAEVVRLTRANRDELPRLLAARIAA